MSLIIAYTAIILNPVGLVDIFNEVALNTAPEIIHIRVNSENSLTWALTWKNSLNGKILKSDVSTAKNYLNEKGIKALERIVSMYLDYAENQAARNIPMKMTDKNQP